MDKINIEIGWDKKNQRFIAYNLEYQIIRTGTTVGDAKQKFKKSFLKENDLGNIDWDEYETQLMIESTKGIRD
jgi:hypothetical protein